MKISLKYDLEVSNDVICDRLKKLTNQIYKLLPLMEEKKD